MEHPGFDKPQQIKYIYIYMNQVDSNKKSRDDQNAPKSGTPLPSDVDRGLYNDPRRPSRER